MSEENRLKLENELLFTKSKAQMINLYLDLQQKVEQLEKELQITANNCKQLETIRKEAIEYVLKNKLYRFKYDDEELFEITTDKKAKDDLLNILNKGSDKE